MCIWGWERLSLAQGYMKPRCIQFCLTSLNHNTFIWKCVLNPKQQLMFGTHLVAQFETVLVPSLIDNDWLPLSPDCLFTTGVLVAYLIKICFGLNRVKLWDALLWDYQYIRILQSSLSPYSFPFFYFCHSVLLFLLSFSQDLCLPSECNTFAICLPC